MNPENEEMAIEPLSDVALYDRYVRSPLLFNSLPFVGFDQAGPMHELERRALLTLTAANQVELRLKQPALAQSRSSTEIELTNDEPDFRPRTVSFPIMGQSIPSSNSVTIIASLTHRHIAPAAAIGLYDRTARLVQNTRTAVFA